MLADAKVPEKKVFFFLFTLKPAEEFHNFPHIQMLTLDCIHVLWLLSGRLKLQIAPVEQASDVLIISTSALFFLGADIVAAFSCLHLDNIICILTEYF